MESLKNDNLPESGDIGVVADAQEAKQLVKSACEVWIKRLIDHSRNNTLLFYRDLKVGTLDLTNTPSALTRLLAGKKLRLDHLLPSAESEHSHTDQPSLFDDDDDSDDNDDNSKEVRRKIQRSLLAIGRKASSNLEEKGLETLFLALGMASWPVVDGGRPYSAPVLLVPVRIQSRSRIGEDISFELAGDPQPNIVMLYVLEESFGVKIDGERLLEAASREDEDGSWEIDSENAYRYIEREATSIRGFTVQHRAVLSNFQFAKMAIVEDLRRNSGQLVSNPLIAAVAGHKATRQKLSRAIEDVDPRSLDQIPPEKEHLILDADSSQQRAIQITCRGQSNIIQGPPGTGKSQTIANLIAELIAQGKRVLFVAEKRAALEAVIKRLEQCGLGHLTLDLHGASISKKLVMSRIADTLYKIQASLPVEYDELFQQYDDRRRRLNEHVERMNASREPTGYSVHNILGRLLRLPQEASTNIRLTGSDLQNLTLERAAHLRQLVNEAASQHLLFLGTDPSPWNNAKVGTGSEAQQASCEARHIAHTLWPPFTSALRELIEELGIGSIQTLNACQEIVILLGEINRLLDTYSERIFLVEPGRLATEMEPFTKNVLISTWALLSNRSFRSIILQLRRLRGKTAPVPVLLEEMNNAEDMLNRWRELHPTLTTPTCIRSYSTISRAMDELLSGISRLKNVVSNIDLLQSNLNDVASYLEALAADNRTIYKLPRIYSLRKELRAAGLGLLIEDTQKRNLPPELWVPCFEYAWLASNLDNAFSKEEQLAVFNGRLHQECLQEFISLDTQRIQLNADRIRRLHGEFAVQAMNDNPDQADVVRREANKRSRHKPLRRLLAEAPDVLTHISPCWIASPLSVSQLLDGNKEYFDVVLFDEASQIVPEEAIPSLFRARQVVVSGDRHQLPPTSFFVSEGEIEDDGTQETMENIGGFESLLDILSTFLPNLMLEWHYRSQDERLIAFSNHHIYDDRLITFPSANNHNVIKGVVVPHDAGLSGQEKSSSPEVETVIRLILDHVKHHPYESLGVITMGIKHANRIQAALDRRLAIEENLGEFFVLDKKEPFFIKNLENVQGDERDAIILSIGYGKDQNGTLPHRFGPLTHDTGHRRLNVAITRARRRITVVSSFTHQEVDLKRSDGRGVDLLKKYLEYADSEGRQLPRNLGAGETSLNPFEADIKDALEARGIPLLPQYGVSRYRIDLVALHPEKPGKPVLAIECDGASYHSSVTARDRDRIRQQQLERLGWRFHRIWSTDWFFHREEEVERAVAAFEEAVRYADVLDKQEFIGISQTVTEKEKNTQITDLTGTLKKPVREPLPSTLETKVIMKSGITQYNRFELRSLAEWAMSDGVLRTDEELLRDMCNALGFKRLGPRIRLALEQALHDARQQQRRKEGKLSLYNLP